MSVGMRNAHVLPKPVVDEFRFQRAQMDEFLAPITGPDGDLQVPEASLPDGLLAPIPGVVAIFHGDVSYGSEETGDKVSAFTLMDPEDESHPTSMSELDWTFHGPPMVDGDGTGFFIVYGRITSIGEITFTKTGPLAGGSGDATPSTHYYTIRWIKRSVNID